MPSKRSRKPHPVPRSELARRAGVSKSAITQAAAKGRALAASAMEDGAIDATHPATIRWARARGIEAKVLRDPTTVARPIGLPAALENPANVEDLLHLTFAEISSRFGSTKGFESWLEARKTTAEIRRIELQNQETQGRVIERKLVETHIIGLLDAQNRRLLGDAPKTITSRVEAVVRSGGTHEEAARIVQDIISSNLQWVKAKASRVLRKNELWNDDDDEQET